MESDKPRVDANYAKLIQAQPSRSLSRFTAHSHTHELLCSFKPEQTWLYVMTETQISNCRKVLAKYSRGLLSFRKNEKYLNAFFGASHVKSIKSWRSFNVPMTATSKVKSQDGRDKVQNRWMKK